MLFLLRQSTTGINLVIAAKSKEDFSWVKKLKIPKLKVLPYIADNSSAAYHTKMNKGHEAMIYHQYFYDFYDDLPDISILIHAHERSWHIDSLHSQNIVSALNSLDLRESSTPPQAKKSPAGIPEQRNMQNSFRANFDIYDIPEFLASPCCSQIVVVREVIQAVPRAQYNRHIEWLLESDLKDDISGRVWEHLWHYLFLRKTIDCPIEHLAYCRLYHICFGGKEAYEEWIGLNKGREGLERELKKLDKADNKGGKEKEQLGALKEIIRIRKELAVARGLIEAYRNAEGDIETMDASNVVNQKLID
ncbi:hypothetical protein DID88_003732 [Monilinia fructigena]|uniref:Uncharacterized protein n=1 Tax=Monilinia fructigena TaxID=38457 RepID=A0A395IZC8_9HELO|nr:hypothetical protein DID88_003732 [Monilinia fructigena]